MANRFFSPDQQFADATGLPYAGGFLYFYTTGTSTPLNTYSDSTLTTPNLNPIVLDSAGRAGSVFLQNLPYKVVLNDVNGVQVWTEDPVWSSDYSTLAQVQPFAGNPNGQLAGFAGTQGALPGSSMVWDYTNDILYVATTTGNATTTVWTAVNAPVTSSFTATPTGYLTLNSDPSNPILTTDAIASTAVYYTPYTGSTVPIYNGTAFAQQTFTQLTLTLTASQAASTLYDVFIFNNSGVPTIVTGPAWTTSTAGSGARGTGASTTQLQRINGIWVNAVQISGKNSSTTYSINASLATYLGTILIDTTPGQVTCHRNYGQSRKWGVWNAYNRVPIYLKAGDATASWSSAVSVGPRLSNASAANSLIVLSGLAEETYDIRMVQNIKLDTNGSNGTITIGAGWNATAFSGTTGTQAINNAGVDVHTVTGISEYISPPSLGANLVNAVEQLIVTTGAVTGTWIGGSGSMILSAMWEG